MWSFIWKIMWRRADFGDLWKIKEFNLDKNIHLAHWVGKHNSGSICLKLMSLFQSIVLPNQLKRLSKRGLNENVEEIIFLTNRWWHWRLICIESEQHQTANNGILTFILFVVHWIHHHFSDWPKAYSRFSKSAPVTSSSCNHIKFARFMLLAHSEEAKT